jgi:hypothetical protein
MCRIEDGRSTARDRPHATCSRQPAADNSRPQAYNFTLGRSNVQQSVHNRQDATGSRSGTRRGGCSRQRWSTSSRRICLPVRNRPCPTCNSHCTTCNRRRVFCRASCATRHTMCNDAIKARMRSRSGMALRRSRRCNVDAWQRAACKVQHAACNMQRAACNMQRAKCNMQRATCSVQSATCSICGRSASCITTHNRPGHMKPAGEG